ncbi:diguanylate cyclase [Tsukamurella asaccharolytica]|uniref:Diguanylate cyclase n=1 Tax=Tsukamurella asaccharolytica TaxID=2592067 RepID=A0A5C5REX1_9ACTN|nr:diguanylate cyclase [Tsukamurella asaccharolytica]TWS21084.1 diguanylate cyclase [Tsukamurella asaccharolytica]
MPESSSPLGFLARGDSVVALLVDEFLLAIADDVYLPLPASVVRAELLAAFQSVIAALGSDPFDPAVGREVGSLLVSLQITVPAGAAAGGRAIATLPDTLTREPSAEVRRRTALILAEYAAGYAEALTRRIIDGQAVVHRAAQLAQRSAEEGERQAQARLRVMFEHARSPVFVADERGRILEASSAMTRMMEANPTLLGPSGDDVRPLLSDDPADVARVLRELADADDEGVTRFLEHRRLRFLGDTSVGRWALSRVPAEGDRPPLLVGAGHDVTELLATHAELSHLAHHDPLTGLPNRRRLQEDLAARRSAPVGFCLVDLDGFKGINDRLGHAVGDQLLIATAARISTSLTGVGTLYRVGGDEFAVLVSPPFLPADAAQLVHRSLSTPIGLPATDDAPAHVVRIGASVGTADTAETGSSVEALIVAADAGLYRSKGARRA